jgi:hypothetical protein
MKNVTLGELIRKTKEIMGPNYDKYNAVDNNCQVYILSIVDAFFRLMNISTTPEVYKRYIYLDVSKALQKNSFAGKLAEKITDIGRVLNKIIGRGKDKNRNINESSTDYSLSDSDIKDFFNNKIKIIKYSDLDNMDLNDLLKPYGRCIILYELEDYQRGHWCLLKYNKKHNMIQYFDSYGIFPENELKYQHPKLRQINKPTKLLKILYNQPYKIEYNNHRLQSTKPGINTCGKWDCVFAQTDMTVDEFAEYIHKLTDKYNISNDELICKLYDALKE